MPTIYPDIIDCINKAPFECTVGEGHVERIPLYFKRYPERAQIFSNPAGNFKVNIPIARMVEMERLGEPFTISNTSEIPLIVQYLQMYIESIRAIIARLDKSDPDTTFYYQAVKFTDLLTKHQEKGSYEFNKKFNVVDEATRPSDLLDRLFG